MMDEIQLIAAAIKAARRRSKEEGLAAGRIACPKCAGNLQFVIRSNPLASPDAPTVWGACETTAGCLQWAM
jgi:hypothetical protein